MATPYSQSLSVSSPCHVCGGRICKNVQTTGVACDPSRASLSSTTSYQTGSQQSSNGNTIPSTYLDLLDSKIAEYKHAAETSTSRGRTTNIETSADCVTRTAFTRNLGPYIQDSRNDSSGNPSSAGSLMMSRFLNDPTEPDSV